MKISSLVLSGATSLKFDFQFNGNKTSSFGYQPYAHDCSQVGPVPDDVRAHYGLDPFYQQYTHTFGIPILGSSLVRSDTLKRACYTVRFMLGDREDLRRAMYNNNGRVAAMAEYPLEVTTDIPEHAFLKNDPVTDWDERARGLGGTLQIPVTTVGEENSLCLNGDRYWNQDILVHEFAHGVQLISAETVDSTFSQRLINTYRTALAAGKWGNTYAATDHIEYFAIGTQAYFNVGAKGPVGGDGIHNHVDNRNTLYDYDIGLYSIIHEVFPCANLIIDRCGDQTGQLDDLKMDCGGSIIPPEDDCVDKNEHCEYWANNGECTINPEYMVPNCPESCGLCDVSCSDENRRCPIWAAVGECQNNPDYMLKHCKESCGLCSLKKGELDDATEDHHASREDAFNTEQKVVKTSYPECVEFQALQKKKNFRPRP